MENVTNDRFPSSSVRFQVSKMLELVNGISVTLLWPVISTTAQWYGTSANIIRNLVINNVEFAVPTNTFVENEILTNSKHKVLSGSGTNLETQFNKINNTRRMQNNTCDRTCRGSHKIRNDA